MTSTTSEVDPAVPRPCARPGCAETVVGTSGKGQLTRYHSRECARQHTSDKSKLTKKCANEACSVPVKRRKTQSLYQFRQQRFHSLACAQRSRWSDTPEQTKPCGYSRCKNVLSSKNYPSRSQYNKAKCCSNVCSNRARLGDRINFREDIEKIRKDCENALCDVKFGIRDDESVANFRKRGYCSDPCRRGRTTAQEQALGEGKKKCALSSCGVIFSRAKNEGIERFKARKYCSKKCVTQSQVGMDRGGVGRKPRAVSYRKKTGPKPVVPGYDKNGNKLTVFGDVAPAEKWVPGSWKKSG